MRSNDRSLYYSGGSLNGWFSGIVDVRTYIMVGLKGKIILRVVKDYTI